MKIIKKFSEGDTIPDGAKFLYSKEEVYKTEEHWRPSPGFWGSVPIFGRETLYRYSYKKPFHYYEVEQDQSTKGAGE